MARFSFLASWLVVLVVVVPAAEAAPGWRTKVDARVLERLDAGDDSACLVWLREQADLSRASTLRTKHEKGTFVFDRLTAVAERTQPRLVAELRRDGVDHRGFWITNMIWVRANADVVAWLAGRDEVAHVYSSPAVKRLEPAAAPVEGATARSAIEWNITQVGADQVWAQGVTGEGVVVGGLDTGVQWDHPALIGQYRGWNGTTADHDYNWHDAAHVSLDPCGGDSPVPCDSHGHGTHITGTMVGDDGGANRIGMAPGAEWIHCRLWEPDLRTDIAYVTECLQWMVAPTDGNDENPDPSKAPHVVSNSWICDPGEGCADANAILSVVNNVRAAGIVVVAGAGNDGPGCSSSQYPPGIYASAVSVGATDRFDEITSFSSRGPILSDGSGRLKPEVCAPGLEVRSAFPGDTYFEWQGTSMATPHVAGLVALLISGNPSLAGQVDEIESLLRNTAVPRTTAQTCGGVPGSQIPNHTYGWGRIDALAAYFASLATDAPDLAQAVVGPRPGAPNPFATATAIRWELPTAQRVTLRIYDVNGRRVRTLLTDALRPSGPGEIVWAGRDDAGRAVAAGTYFARLETGPRAETRRLTLLR